jgi:leader peptidase (prepilin peptidase) / N-methyltransferase
MAILCGLLGIAVAPLLDVLIRRVPDRDADSTVRARIPAGQFLTPLLFAAVGARFHDSWVLPAYLVFTGGVIALALIDLELFVIPNRLLYPLGFVAVPLLGAGALIEGELDAFARALLAGIVAFLAFFVLHTISPRGLGFGDVRLSFLLGCFLGWLGWGHVAFGLFAGFVYGAIAGLVLVAMGRRTRRQHIPFGPFLVAGALTAVLAGEPILDWYGG